MDAIELSPPVNVTEGNRRTAFRAGLGVHEQELAGAIEASTQSKKRLR